MADLRASPELFPLAVDPATDRVQFVRLAPVDYERASFLDARLSAPIEAEVSYGEVAAAMAGAPIACDYIFHIGHVGSTLLSRLLGVHPRIFSLREPQVLRTFVQAQAAERPWTASELDARLATFQALFSRTWAPPKRSLVKATSMVCALAGRLMAQNPDARAICMTVPLETYLPTMLSGANLGDLQQAAPFRLPRLFHRLGKAAPEQLSPGELIAMSWAADMADLKALYAHRVLWIDFDEFLDDPRAGIAAALIHLHGAADPVEVEAIAGSAYFQRYSKAPEYAYGPDLRRQVLDEARQNHAAEIARGLDMHRALGL